MADLEVEDTLREIRERVLAESASAGAESRPLNDAPEALMPAGGGASSKNGRASDALARMQANLTTTERTRSRLPPLLSNRSGWIAQLELWLKRQIKRAAHWFTWEQVNFNSAVHHALGDAHDALAQANSDIAALRASFERVISEAAAEKARTNEMLARMATTESRFDSGLADLRRLLDARIEQLRVEQQAHVNGLRTEQQALAGSIHAEQQALADGLRAERAAHILAREEEFQNEMRERIENLLEEQRVCFKQLSLETGESANAQERARRQLEARIEALEQNSSTSDK